MDSPDNSIASALPSTRKIEAVIYAMTALINLGKYLPWIELGLGILNSVFAYLNLFVYYSYTSGIINVLFAIGSFAFYAQLLPRRNVHRYEYRYTGRHQRAATSGSSFSGKQAGAKDSWTGTEANSSAEA